VEGKKMAIRAHVRFTKAPVMIAAWPGMGNVGLMATQYLHQKLHAELFAAVDMKAFVAPGATPVRDGHLLPVEEPTSNFAFHRDPDLVLFESNTQVEGKEAPFYVQTILELARQLHVTRIYTIAAFPTAMSHVESGNLYFASNSDAISQEMREMGVKPLRFGEIAGTTGLMTTMAGTSGIEAACIIAPIPMYAGSFSYPKAVLSTLEAFETLLGVSVDLHDVREMVVDMEEMFEQMEEQLRQRFPSLFTNDHESGLLPEGIMSIEDEEESDKPAKAEERHVPEEARERIARLFVEASTDRSKAVELKKELDRWKLYEHFEDKFLDLFRSRNEENDD
jgi:predicted ATP-grasp superfamily ATP-dependent carboligase